MAKRVLQKFHAASRCKAMRSRAVIKTNQGPNEPCELGIGAQNRSLQVVNEDSSTAATQQMPPKETSARPSKYGVSIRGIGVSLPKHVIRNEDLTALVDTSDEWITTRTGFKERRVVSGDELLTDLAVETAQNALAYAGISGEEVDLIINASSTADYIYPAGCGVVQAAIGAKHAFGFDMAMGCSGLIYAICIATQFIENGTVRTALVITADVHSRYTDWQDRNTCVLFGDGAGGFVLTRSDSLDKNDILAIDMMLDGSRGKEIRLPVDRDNCPLVAPRTVKEKPVIYMNGREVFKFAVGEVPQMIEATIDKAGLTSKDIDFYILHQANARIMTAMTERMNVRDEQIISHMEKYSNTSASTIPLAMYDALEAGEIQPGSTIVFCGFGAGLAAATVVVKWNCVDQRKELSNQVNKGEHMGSPLPHTVGDDPCVVPSIPHTVGDDPCVVPSQK